MFMITFLLLINQSTTSLSTTGDIMKLSEICYKSYIGQCWVTEYGIMTKDNCCFSKSMNWTVTSENNMGPVRDCYRIDNNKVNSILAVHNKDVKSSEYLIHYYIEKNRIMPNCNIYSSCQIKSISWGIRQTPKSQNHIAINLADTFTNIKKYINEFYKKQTQLEQIFISLFIFGLSMIATSMIITSFAIIPIPHS